MKIVENRGVFVKTVEYDYKPTSAELWFYYSGTHAGPNRDNPYNIYRNSYVTTTRYTPVKED